MEQSSPVLVQQLLRQTRQLSPSDLRKYFDGLFQRMTIASKEAMTEIM
jgi:restriction endonuclease Mrr